MFVERKEGKKEGRMEERKGHPDSGVIKHMPTHVCAHVGHMSYRKMS